MRWAIVASGTRKAAAISLVVSPPTARSVRGMADAGVSDGWQHMNIRISESSRPGAGSGGVSDHEAARSSRRRRASSLRYRSAIRRDATRMSQPNGLSGSPSTGQVVVAARRASWVASSAAAKSP